MLERKLIAQEPETGAPSLSARLLSIDERVAEAQEFGAT